MEADCSAARRKGFSRTANFRTGAGAAKWKGRQRMSKKGKESITDMLDLIEQNGNCPMTFNEAVKLLQEYQGIQRGGYWKHGSHDEEARSIAAWHRAIDLAILALKTLNKVKTLVEALKVLANKGDYPKVMPSAKSVRMDYAKLGDEKTVKRKSAKSK